MTPSIDRRSRKIDLRGLRNIREDGKTPSSPLETVRDGRNEDHRGLRNIREDYKTLGRLPL